VVGSTPRQGTGRGRAGTGFAQGSYRLGATRPGVLNPKLIASASRDLYGVALKCDTRRVVDKDRDECRHVVASLHPPEAALSVQHAGGRPALDHLGVPPPFHISGGASNNGDHGFDGVGTSEASSEAIGNLEVPDREHVLETFSHTRRSIGQTALEPAGEIFRQAEPDGWVPAVEGLGEPSVHPSLLRFWEVGGHVSPLVQIMRTSS
jgi:hypothetical protein